MTESSLSLIARGASLADAAASDPGWAQWRNVLCLLRGAIVPDASVQDVVVPFSPYTIGRHSDNHLCLCNPTVSGRHAKITSLMGRLFVEDLGSTNGTFVNGIRVTGSTEIRDQDHLQFGTAQFQVHLNLEPRPEATISADVAGQALAHVQFTRLVNEQAFEPHLQPIVQLADGKCVGFEILARSRLIGLETPATMFRVAVERHMEVELSQVLRHVGVSSGRSAGPELDLYVNTHPSELVRPGLIESLERLRAEFPEPKLLLEVHEAAITTPGFLKELHPRLNDLNIGLVYDDFGAGQARLLELVEVPPEVIKFDIRLVQRLESAPRAHQLVVRSLVDIVKALGVIPLAEGVETAEEAEACRSAGFQLAQGFHFGRPAPPDHWRQRPSPGPVS